MCQIINTVYIFNQSINRCFVIIFSTVEFRRYVASFNPLMGTLKPQNRDLNGLPRGSADQRPLSHKAEVIIIWKPSWRKHHSRFLESS